MGYYTTSDNTRVYFQNGMDNHAPDAKGQLALVVRIVPATKCAHGACTAYKAASTAYSMKPRWRWW